MTDLVLSPRAADALHPVSPGSYLDIAVHLDGSLEDDLRLAHAEMLATRCEARLTGLFTNLLPDPALYAGAFGTTTIGQLTDGAIQEGNVTELRLLQRLARLGSPHELRRIEAVPYLLERAVATEALSELLGLRRATVSEACTALSNAGLIAHSRGSMSVVDHDGLRGRVCECYGRITAAYRRGATGRPAHLACR